MSGIDPEDLFLPALDDDEEYDMDGVVHKCPVGTHSVGGSSGMGRVVTRWSRAC